MCWSTQSYFQRGRILYRICACERSVDKQCHETEVFRNAISSLTQAFSNDISLQQSRWSHYKKTLVPTKCCNNGRIKRMRERASIVAANEGLV